MTERESSPERDANWQSFVDALCAAASTWDTDLARFSAGEELHVPISAAQAENVLLAIAALSQRMGRATAAIVRATAKARLDPSADTSDLAGHVESLGRMALYAQAMHEAAELARAVVNDA